MKLEFKKGSKYSRKDIGWVCFPDKGRPAGGDWDTGYVRVEDNLIIFLISNFFWTSLILKPGVYLVIFLAATNLCSLDTNPIVGNTLSYLIFFVKHLRLSLS